MAANGNNNRLVSVGAAGKIYIGGDTAQAPTNATDALGDGWQNFGYISEDGVTISEDSDSEQLTSWGGVGVRTVRTSYSESVAFTPIEVNKIVLKAMYGDDNVDVKADTSGTTHIVSKHSGVNLPEVKICVDVLHSSDSKGRYYAPKAQLSERGDLEMKGTEAAGREMTYSCNADDDGVTLYEYTDYKTKKDASSTTPTSSKAGE